MQNVYEVIKKPLFTEKGAMLKEADGKLLVEVAVAASKAEIKAAIEKIFSVKVRKVHTIKLPGKWKTQGRSKGKRPARKKAIITLREGESLDFIEGS